MLTGYNKKEQKTTLRETFKEKKKKVLKGTLQDVLRHVLLDTILLVEYFYEMLFFNLCLNYRHKNNFLKMIFKVIDYKYDNVYNDILSKQTNGIKTTTTTNSQMLEIFVKVEKAKPMSIFGLKLKKTPSLFPRMKEFFNLTGGSVGFKTFYFYDNINYYNTHPLKPFEETKTIMIYILINDLANYKDKMLKKPYIKQKKRKRKFKLNLRGYRIKIKNKYRKYKHNFFKVVLTGIKDRTYVNKMRRKKLKQMKKF